MSEPEMLRDGVSHDTTSSGASIAKEQQADD
jgi:hypothetical protein